jgi:signal transduction histidine kinase
LELAAFRIVQEALTNVARHGGTDSADVYVAEQEGVLHVRVSDAGSGFDPAAIGPGTEAGLIGMRERAILLGGTFSIESSPGNGTIVKAELPIA